MPSTLILEAVRSQGHHLTEGGSGLCTLGLGTGPPLGTTAGTVP